MRKACENASIAHFHPHDLRHRYASVKIAEGRPGDASGGAARALEEVAYAGYLLARSRRLRGAKAT
jgi:integrase